MINRLTPKIMLIAKQKLKINKSYEDGNADKDKLIIRGTCDPKTDDQILIKNIGNITKKHTAQII